MQLAKTESRTDWRKRPLTHAQIDYALDDVNHLGNLYQELSDSLNNKNRYQWLLEECEHIIATEHYFVSPAAAWKQVKGLGKLNAQQFYYLRNIASWREQRAQHKNLPRRWLLPDPAMLELCQLKTLNPESIQTCLQENAPKSKRHSDKLAEILCLSIPDNQVDQLEAPEDNRLSKEQRQLVKKLMEITRNKAQDIGTSASLLANRKSLVNLILGKTSKVSVGWRKNEIGDELHAAIQSTKD